MNEDQNRPRTASAGGGREGICEMARVQAVSEIARHGHAAIRLVLLERGVERRRAGEIDHRPCGAEARAQLSPRRPRERASGRQERRAKSRGETQQQAPAFQ